MEAAVTQAVFPPGSLSISDSDSDVLHFLLLSASTPLHSLNNLTLLFGFRLTSHTVLIPGSGGFTNYPADNTAQFNLFYQPQLLLVL